MYKIPVNGLYLTASDGEEYQNLFDINSKNVTNGCKECAGACAGCNKGNIKTVTFIMTENCNLACTYCYEKHKTSKKMTKEIAKAGVDFLFSEKMYPYFEEDGLDGLIVEFFGGEPLLEAELMDYIATYFKEQCFKKNMTWLQNSMFSLTSNGTLYFSKPVQKYLKKHGKKTSMGITIDGNKQLHDACRVFHNGEGSYDIVSKAIVDWQEKSNTIKGTKVTIAPENMNYIFDAFINLWENLDIQFLASNCVFEDVWKPEHEQVLYDQLVKVADYLIDNDLYAKYYTAFFDEDLGIRETVWDKNLCGGNGEMLAIGTDGRLYPCMRFMDYALSYREGKCIGNIYDGITIDDPWLQELKAVTLESQSDDECKNCKISKGCALCTGWHYDIFGTPNKRAKFICGMHKARVCANEYYWNKLYSKLGLDKKFVLNTENIYRK